MTAKSLSALNSKIDYTKDSTFIPAVDQWGRKYPQRGGEGTGISTLWRSNMSDVQVTGFTADGYTNLWEKQGALCFRYRSPDKIINPVARRVFYCLRQSYPQLGEKIGPKNPSVGGSGNSDSGDMIKESRRDDLYSHNQQWKFNEKSDQRAKSCSKSKAL